MNLFAFLRKKKSQKLLLKYYLIDTLNRLVKNGELKVTIFYC